MKKILLFAILTLGANIYAQVSNVALVCRDQNQKIVSAELREAYEARIIRNAAFADSSNYPLRQYLEQFINKIEKYQRIPQWLQESYGISATNLAKDIEAYLVDPAPIKRINETLFTNDKLVGHINKLPNILPPESCQLEIVSTILRKEFEEDPHQIVQVDILKKLDDVNLKMLLMRHHLLSLFGSLYSSHISTEVSKIEPTQFNFISFLRMAKNLGAVHGDDEFELPVRMRNGKNAYDSIKLSSINFLDESNAIVDLKRKYYNHHRSQTIFAPEFTMRLVFNNDYEVNVEKTKLHGFVNASFRSHFNHENQEYSPGASIFRPKLLLDRVTSIEESFKVDGKLIKWDENSGYAFVYRTPLKIGTSTINYSFKAQCKRKVRKKKYYFEGFKFRLGYKFDTTTEVNILNESNKNNVCLQKINKNIETTIEINENSELFISFEEQGI